MKNLYRIGRGFTVRNDYAKPHGDECGKQKREVMMTKTDRRTDRTDRSPTSYSGKPNSARYAYVKRVLEEERRAREKYEAAMADTRAARGGSK